MPADEAWRLNVMSHARAAEHANGMLHACDAEGLQAPCPHGHL